MKPFLQSFTRLESTVHLSSQTNQTSPSYAPDYRSVRSLHHHFFTLLVLLAFTVSFAQGSLPKGFAHGTAQVGGVQLHYVRGGEGEPVLLVHGWPTTWYEWHQVMPLLAERYDVIAVDLRGAGNSDKPLTGYDKRTLAADLGGLVESLELGPIHYVGHDIGGMVGYAFAHEYPELTRSYTVLDVPLPGIQPLWNQVNAYQGSWHFRFHTVRDLPELLVQGQERAYIDFFINDTSPNAAVIPDATIDVYAKAYAVPGGMRAGFEYYRAFSQDELDNARYTETPLTVPVLALGAEFSSGASIAEMMEGLAENVQGGVIEGAGHWVAEEKPNVLAKRLLEFLVEVDDMPVGE